jgi:hypothetical protein
MQSHLQSRDRRTAKAEIMKAASETDQAVSRAGGEIRVHQRKLAFISGSKSVFIRVHPWLKSKF